MCCKCKGCVWCAGGASVARPESPEEWAEKVSRKKRGYGTAALISAAIGLMSALLLCCCPCAAQAVVLVSCAAAAGCCGGIMLYVYGGRGYLDADRDPERHIRAMELAETRCLFIQRDWCRKERIRGLIAAGRTDEAEAALEADGFEKYGAEKAGMLGICAIRKGDGELMEKAERILASRRSGRAAQIYYEWVKERGKYADAAEE